MVMKDYDAEAEARRKKDARAAALRDQNIDEAVGALVNTKVGRDFLWWLLDVGKVGLQPFAIDPIIMSFQCGELNVGQQILDRIVTVNAEGYLRMLKEKQDDATRRTQLDNDARSALDADAASSERSATDDGS